MKITRYSFQLRDNCKIFVKGYRYLTFLLKIKVKTLVKIKAKT